MGKGTTVTSCELVRTVRAANISTSPRVVLFLIIGLRSLSVETTQKTLRLFFQNFCEEMINTTGKNREERSISTEEVTWNYCNFMWTDDIKYSFAQKKVTTAAVAIYVEWEGAEEKW